MKGARFFFAIAAITLAACSTGASAAKWTGAAGAQPLATADAACREISAGVETNFVTCMAGRGWARRPR